MNILIGLLAFLLLIFFLAVLGGSLGIIFFCFQNIKHVSENKGFKNERTRKNK